MREELLAPHPAPDEAAAETGPGPRRLAEFVGQPELKAHLDIVLEAARRRGQAPDHLLFAGPPGLGKTTLATIIANELDAHLQTTSGPALERAGDLAAILTQLDDGDVLFVDEIHRLPRAVEEVLYPAMEDFQLDIVLGKGPAARSIRLDLPQFTLVGATTRTGSITGPLRDRFGVVARLDYYTAADLEAIVHRAAGILGVEIDDAGCREIARRARGTPRIANRLLRRVRDFAEGRSDGRVDRRTAHPARAVPRVGRRAGRPVHPGHQRRRANRDCRGRVRAVPHPAGPAHAHAPRPGRPAHRVGAPRSHPTPGRPAGYRRHALRRLIPGVTLSTDHEHRRWATIAVPGSWRRPRTHAGRFAAPHGTRRLRLRPARGVDRTGADRAPRSGTPARRPGTRPPAGAPHRRPPAVPHPPGRRARGQHHEGAARPPDPAQADRRRGRGPAAGAAGDRRLGGAGPPQPQGPTRNRADGEGSREVVLTVPRGVDELAVLDRYGVVPLPPYITAPLADPERYQTVFAERPGSVAAPTAGLHITPAVLDGCRAAGARVEPVELLVGMGTFRPMTAPKVDDHHMHAERYRVPPGTLAACEQVRAAGGRVVAVGTTSVRALETAALSGRLEGRTELFIHRPWQWRLVDVLMTNFHLPRSSLLVLVDAFIGPRWRELYGTALAEGYRFLSFGDAMLLEARA